MTKAKAMAEYKAKRELEWAQFLRRCKAISTTPTKKVALDNFWSNFIEQQRI